MWGLLEPVHAPPCCSSTGGLVGTRQIEHKFCDKAVHKAWAGSKDAPRKLRRFRAMGRLLCSPATQLSLLLTDLLHLPAVYQRGCLVLQQTCAVFFPLHLCAGQMWWQLVFLGCPQWERQQLIDRIVRAQQASLQPGTMGWTFRCRFCGLLQQHAKTILDHFRRCHPDYCWIHARQEKNYEPDRLRRASVVTLPLINTLAGGL